LEVGPQATLLGMAGHSLDALTGESSGQEAGGTAFLPSLRPGQSDWQQLLSSLGALYVRGAQIDWEGIDRGYSRRKVALPTYPFQRQRYWVQSRPSRRAAASLRPLIDQMTQLPALQSVLFESEFSVEAMPFLADHRVYGEVVSPGAGQLVLALHAAQLCLGEETALKLEDVVLPQPLVLPEGQPRSVQAIFKAEQAAHTFQLVSLLPASSETTVLSEKTATHASGQASRWRESAAPTASLAALRQRCSQPVDLDSFYAGLEAAQIALGPSFRWLEAAWQGASAAPELLARLVQPSAVESLQGYLLHPGLLDGCFQAAGLLGPSGETLLPFALESLAVQRAATAGEWWCHVTQRAPDRYDLLLLDAAGSTVAQVRGFQTRAASAAAIRGREMWQEWLYTVDWQPHPYFGLPPEFLASPPLAAPGWQAAALQQVPEPRRQQAAHLQQALEALSLELVVAAFDSAGFHFEPGSRWRSEQIARHLGVIPAYRRLLERLLEMLAEAGIFQPESDGWRVQQRPTAHDPADTLALLRAEYGDTPELRLLARCGLKLAAVLRGLQDPLELLFPGGETSDATRLYTETPGAQLMNGLVQAVVQDTCRELPAGRGLRILEVGAGTGSTTAGLLPLLPVHQSDYLFTDIGASFLRNAAERFASYPFVRYQPLDIEQDPASQGFRAHQADLVVAANVLHATSDLGQTLDHVHQLLLPGGQLLLIEATERRRWIDLTFGLTDGWWRYADERQGHPLLSAEGWRQQLSAHGFVDVAVLEQAGQAVIVAKAGPHASLTHRWLILADRQGVGAALASQLRQQGDTVQVVYRASTEGEMKRPTAEQLLFLQPDAAQEYLQLLHPAPDRVVHLWSLDTPALPDSPLLGRDGAPLDLVAAAETGYASALLLVQALLKAEVKPASLWLVTRDAQPAGSRNPVQGAIQSGLWGMGKVIDLEHPELNPVCIDLPQDGDAELQAGWLRTVLATSTGMREQQIALRAEGQYLARLQRCRQSSAPPQPLHPDGTYLITGGLGGVGLATARWLAEQGARHLLLLGRSLPRAEAQAQVEQMAALGATVTVVQGDVADWEGMRALLAQIDPARPLRGVIHSVGVLDDAALLQQSWPRFAAVLAPKLQGAWNLHALTQGLDLDFFVLFSSVASLLGSPGQANHAAANAFLDAFVHHRRQQGLPALSINWGAWSEIGAAAALARKIQAGQGRAGMGVIAPAAGVAAFAALLAQPEAQVGVVPIQWPQFLQGAETVHAYLAEFRRTLPAVSTSVQSSYRQLLEATPEKRAPLMHTYVQEVVAQTLQATQPLAVDAGFNELGLDSLMAIELRRRLEKRLQLTLPSTVAFEYPTVRTLSAYLLERLQEAAGEQERVAEPQRVLSEGAAPVRVQEAAAALEEPIAVIGMACRFPGAETPEEFWTLLAKGEDQIRPVPPARWRVEQSYDPVPGTPGKSYQRDAALLTQVDSFDPAFFGISPREAQRMDPQHRLLLEVSWEALERAGQVPAALQGSRTGVFTGISASDYLGLMGELERSEAHASFGNSVIFGVGRLSYVLGLQGPSLVINTACSASLIGVHLACESLRTRSSDLALAGGVHLLLSEQSGIVMSQMLALSPDGRSKPFDASANGFGRGEGCGMVVLKRLSDAQADGDPILALIRGSATNHDGPSSGLTVPSATAQTALIRQALAAGKVAAHEVTYVEAHGTGTVLGDPIEVRALNSVFERRESPLWVGSVKSNIGHLEEAAGIAGLIKVILSMQHGELPSSLHFRQPNPHIDWEKSAVRVVAERQIWPAGRKIAGVSSFGMGGSNAHVVVEGVPALQHGHPEAGQPAERPQQIFTLSARDDAALAAYVHSYVDFLAAHPELDLGDLSYTSHLGRSHFSHRLSVVAGSVAELGEKLAAVSRGDQEPQRGVVAAEQAAPRVAFLFTGQGAQYTSMGRELYETEPLFRESIDRCAALLAGQLEVPLLELLGYSGEAQSIDRTENTQPALFVLEYALAQLWRSWGVEPELLLGHSVGELAAACVAGVFSLEDGIKLVAARGR
ncbi:MAG: SDR family NAD(P)-dependent oxidoreductase, partial [Caldilinea sp.]